MKTIKEKSTNKNYSNDNYRTTFCGTAFAFEYLPVAVANGTLTVGRGGVGGGTRSLVVAFGVHCHRAVMTNGL